jgi:hypothetical protein
VAKHQEQKAPVAGLKAAALGGGQELFNLVAGEVFSVICHFVQFLGQKSARAFRHGAGRFFEYGQLV